MTHEEIVSEVRRDARIADLKLALCAWAVMAVAIALNCMIRGYSFANFMTYLIVGEIVPTAAVVGLMKNRNEKD